MSENRRYNLIKGVAAILVLLAGLGFFLAFRGGLFDGSFPWLIIAIVGGIVVFLLAIMLFIPGKKIQRRPFSLTSATATEYEKKFEKETQRRKEQGIFQSQKQQINEEDRFCDYCGVILKEAETYCPNCGHRIS
jgi:hypothetical protein